MYIGKLKLKLIFYLDYSVLHRMRIIRKKERFISDIYMSHVLVVLKDHKGTPKDARVKALEKHENLMLNIGSLSCGGRIITVKAESKYDMYME